jgi:hypothetical protein
MLVKDLVYGSLGGFFILIPLYEGKCSFFSIPISTLLKMFYTYEHNFTSTAKCATHKNDVVIHASLF